MNVDPEVVHEDGILASRGAFASVLSDALLLETIGAMLLASYFHLRKAKGHYPSRNDGDRRASFPASIRLMTMMDEDSHM